MTQGLAAIVAVGAVVVAAVVLTGNQNLARSQQPIAPLPTVRGPISPAFVESINECERLVVTRPQVESALDFRVEEVGPWAGAPRGTR